MSKINVKVLADKCIGCGTCAALAPATFQINEECISVVVDQEGNSDEEKLEAAQACPVEAIEAIDAETGEILWPK